MIRLVRAYWKARGQPQRTRFVTLNQGYHGSSSGAAMLTGIPLFNQQMEPGLPGVHHMARPHCYPLRAGEDLAELSPCLRRRAGEDSRAGGSGR